MAVASSGKTTIRCSMDWFRGPAACQSSGVSLSLSERFWRARKEGLLSRILFHKGDMKRTIASLARVVTRFAFQTEYPDPQALDIFTSAARSPARIVRLLSRKQIWDPPTSSLILSESWMITPGFQELVLGELSRRGICSFKNMVIVDDVSSDAAWFLARQTSRTS